MKNQKATNPVNKMFHQYAVLVMINHEEIKKDLQRIKIIKPV